MEGDNSMNLEVELAILCEKVLELLKELKEQSLISDEEYETHSKLKIEFLERNLLKAK